MGKCRLKTNPPGLFTMFMDDDHPRARVRLVVRFFHRTSIR